MRKQAEPLDPNVAPVLGRVYLVPTITNRHGQIVPVLGGWHKDPEISKSLGEHIHLDARFLPARMFKSKRGYRGSDYDKDGFVLAQVETLHFLNTEEKPKITLRPMKCLRVMPHFLDTAPIGRKNTSWPQEMRCTYQDVKLTDALVCPHRGIHLAPFEENGFAVCPGHGLCWNLREKRLATEEEEQAVRKARKAEGEASEV